VKEIIPADRLRLLQLEDGLDWEKARSWVFRFRSRIIPSGMSLRSSKLWF